MTKRPSTQTAKVLWLIAAGMGSMHGHAAEVVGTAYTVLLRGNVAPVSAQAPNPYATRRPPPSRAVETGAGSLRLVDGRSGQQLATAAYDAQLGGYMFRLPLVADVSRGPVCMVLKNAAGISMPVRDERRGDDGFAFRNEAWEVEVARQDELRELKNELSTVTGQLDGAARQLQKLQAENGGIETAARCEVGRAETEPARPPAALSSEEAAEAAPGLCAVLWERAFSRIKVDPGRLFGEAGLAADWTRRAPLRDAADAMRGLELALNERDARMITDAAVKGVTYLEHADGVRALVRVQGQCKAEVPRLAAAQLQQWQAQVEAARAAPLRAKSACEQRVARIEQLRTALANGPTFRAELDKRIAKLDAAAPLASDSRRIDGQSCKDL